jgi:hypothetical protein
LLVLLELNLDPGKPDLGGGSNLADHARMHR